MKLNNGNKQRGKKYIKEVLGNFSNSKLSKLIIAESDI